MNTTKKPKTRQKHSHNTALQGEFLTPNEIANYELGNILTQSLAAFILLRSKEPVCDVIQDLFEIESDAAALVGTFCTDQQKITSLRGTLVSAFSLIPIGRSQSVRDVTPKNATIFPSRKGHTKNSPNSRKKGE